MLRLRKEGLVPQLHLHDGPAHGRHGAQDFQFSTAARDAAAFGLLPYEVGLVFVVHFFVQLLVALSAHIVDAHSHPVLVQVVVVRDWEHDSDLLCGGLVALLEHVVGQDPDGAAGGGADLAEVAHLGFLRSHGGLRRAVAVATLQVDPLERARASARGVSTSKRDLHCRRLAGLLLGVKEAKVVGDVGELNGDISSAFLIGC